MSSIYFPSGCATGQRLMNILLVGLQWQDCLVYLDDIIVMEKLLRIIL